jgi:hypothetical protein
MPRLRPGRFCKKLISKPGARYHARGRSAWGGKVSRFRRLEKARARESGTTQRSVRVRDYDGLEVSTAVAGRAGPERSV